MVLLKNENNLLPLDIKKLKNVLVTGPMAAETNYAYSRYGPSFNEVVSVYQGIKKYAADKLDVKYVKGCEVIDESWPESELMEVPLTAEEQAGIDAAVEQAKKSDVVIAVMGENESRVGESKTRTNLELQEDNFNL